MSQKKRDEIHVKKHSEMHEIPPFFQIFFRNRTPLQRSLAPSKLNLAAPIEICWLHLFKFKAFCVINGVNEQNLNNWYPFYHA